MIPIFRGDSNCELVCINNEPQYGLGCTDHKLVPFFKREWTLAYFNMRAIAYYKDCFDRGCKQVATLTGDLEASAGQDRLAGYKQAHLEAGREVNEDLVAQANWTFESAKIMTLRLLAKNPDIDGIFAANDTMALGVVAALQERGRVVPGPAGAGAD